MGEEYRIKKSNYLWKKHHEADIFLDRNKDHLGLDVVCVVGYPLNYNKFLHHFNKKSVDSLTSKIGFIKGKEVLDIGCGTGRWSRYYDKKGAKVTGIDLSKRRMTDNRKRMPKIDFKVMSADNLKFRSGKFDIVNSVVVLQHIPSESQKKVAEEMARVTKKGGHILVIEGVNEKNVHLKNSFALPAKSWIRLFEDNGCKCIYQEKNLNTFILDSYISLKNKFLRIIKRLAGIKQEAYSLNEYDKAIKEIKRRKEAEKKRINVLKSLFRLFDRAFIVVLVYISYPVEYINNNIFKRFNEGVGAFLFVKK